MRTGPADHKLAMAARSASRRAEWGRPPDRRLTVMSSANRGRISGHYCAWYRSSEQRRGDATRHRTHYRAKKDPCQRSKDGVNDALLVPIRADLKTTTAVAPLRLDYLPASSLEMVPSSLRACFRIKPSFLRAGS